MPLERKWLMWSIHLHRIWQPLLKSPKARTFLSEVWRFSISFYQCVHSLSWYQVNSCIVNQVNSWLCRRGEERKGHNLSCTTMPWPHRGWGTSKPGLVSRQSWRKEFRGRPSRVNLDGWAQEILDVVFPGQLHHTLSGRLDSSRKRLSLLMAFLWRSELTHALSERYQWLQWEKVWREGYPTDIHRSGSVFMTGHPPHWACFLVRAMQLKKIKPQEGMGLSIITPLKQCLVLSECFKQC